MNAGALLGMLVLGYVVYAAFKGQGAPTVSGGQCPGSPGCPGNVTGYTTDFGVTVTPPSSGTMVNCPGSPGCPGYIGLSGWEV